MTDKRQQLTEGQVIIENEGQTSVRDNKHVTEGLTTIPREGS